MPPETRSGSLFSLEGRKHLLDAAKRRRAQSPEGIAGAERARSLARGREIQESGIQALERFDPEQFLGADALAAIFDEATATTFMPQLRGLQARNAARGIRGPLAGALEGDLASGFQRSLLARTAEFGGERARLAFGRGRELAEIGGTERAQGLSLLGTELELALAREQAEKKRKSGVLGTIGRGLGMAGGFLIGGPAGAAVGGELGSGAARVFS